MQKIAIIGSKIFKNSKLINRYIKPLNPKKITVLTGVSTGVNAYVRSATKKYGIPTIVYKPDFAKYGTQATIVVNKRIIAEADTIAIFYNGTSLITKCLIDETKELGKDLELIVDK